MRYICEPQHPDFFFRGVDCGGRWSLQQSQIFTASPMPARARTALPGLSAGSAEFARLGKAMVGVAVGCAQRGSVLKMSSVVVRPQPRGPGRSRSCGVTNRSNSGGVSAALASPSPADWTQWEGKGRRDDFSAAIGDLFAMDGRSGLLATTVLLPRGLPPPNIRRDSAR